MNSKAMVSISSQKSTWANFAEKLLVIQRLGNIEKRDGDREIELEIDGDSFIQITDAIVGLFLQIFQANRQQIAILQNLRCWWVVTLLILIRTLHSNFLLTIIPNSFYFFVPKILVFPIYAHIFFSLVTGR